MITTIITKRIIRNYYSLNVKRLTRIPELAIVSFLALIQVLSPININNENKGRICLPDDDNPVADDQDCYATGWGFVEEGGFPSDILREVKIKRVPLTTCKAEEPYGETIDETMTCAGYSQGGKDTCQGDSGNSMVCRVNGKFSHTIYLKKLALVLLRLLQLLKMLLRNSSVSKCKFWNIWKKTNLKFENFRLSIFFVAIV